jgi:murein DD-endopeptidase MepM/ murein hydrolase activator NlpD
VNRTTTVVFIAALAALFAACAPEIVEEPFEPSASHRDYREALARLNLDETSLGRGWITAAGAAFLDPVTVETPFEERTLLDPQQPSALAYEFDVERGRAVTISIETDLELYVADLFRVDEAVSRSAGDAASAQSEQSGGGEPAPVPPGFTLVASRPNESNQIRFEPRRDGTYLLRVQPELLRGGGVGVTIVATASLAFPVRDAGPGDIRSFYGDVRDGGTRKHEGIDIFAPRGTELIAASDALVARVGIRDRGGNIVTLYDEERDLLMYYAHLEEQRVEQGDRVRRGDVVGTTGNSGNAITTPPHLHIGIYQGSWRRDVDPWNYFIDPPLTDPPPAQHGDLVGAWLTVPLDTVAVRGVRAPAVPVRWVNRNPLLRGVGAGESRGGTAQRSTDAAAGDPRVDANGSEPRPGARSGEAGERAPVRLAAGAAVRVVGASSAYVRVRTPGGTEGYLRPDTLSSEPERQTLNRQRLARDPATGDPFTELPAGTSVELWGRFEGQSVVVLPSGRAGLVAYD